MSLLSPRLQLRVAQKQILTPGLVQMVTVLQLNRLELKEMISQEIALNPVLEESIDGIEEVSQEEVQAMLERERSAEPADQSILQQLSQTDAAGESEPVESFADAGSSPAASDFTSEFTSDFASDSTPAAAPVEAEQIEPKKDSDPFDEIDFGSFFDEYLDPGYKTPSAEAVEKPSFETFLSAPVTLADHLQSQLSIEILSEQIREAADSIIGNLDDDGYLMMSVEELAESGQHTIEDVTAALKAVQSLDPSGVAARDMRECLLIQLENHNGRGGVAW
ncbi:MAG: RNA polymerase sigma-54 factor, partial [Bryobacteraceae bacterium]